MSGKDAVVGFNTAVFTKFYEPGSVRVDIHDELGDESSSVVRFDFHAMSRRGNPYDVEYVLFVKTRDGLVYDVVELLDTHASNEQHAGRRVERSPRSLSSTRRPPIPRQRWLHVAEVELVDVHRLYHGT